MECGLKWRNKTTDEIIEWNGIVRSGSILYIPKGATYNYE